MAELDLNDAAIFVKVVDRGGFAKVARDLHVPTSTISRAVSRLEQALGARLVERTTRNMMPSDEGRAFYNDIAPAIISLHNAARSFEGADRALRGRLRISAPIDLGTTFLPGVIVEFTQRYPRVRVEVALSSRRVKLVEEGYDVALRAGPLEDSSLISRKLGDVNIDLYASVAYVESRGLPESIDALDQHACVMWRARDGETEWKLSGPDGVEIKKTIRGRIGGDDFGFVRAAILAGGGIGPLPRIVAGREPRGSLARVLPAYSIAAGGLYLVHVSARQVPARIALFGDFVAGAFTRATNALVV